MARPSGDDRSDDREALFVLDELGGTGRWIHLRTRGWRRETQMRQDRFMGTRGGGGRCEKEELDGKGRGYLQVFIRAGVRAETWMASWEAIFSK